jgi:hypothetical protein
LEEKDETIDVDGSDLSGRANRRSQGSAASPAANAVRRTLDRYSQNLVATAQEMPAEKYGYHPTPVI